MFAVVAEASSSPTPTGHALAPTTVPFGRYHLRERLGEGSNVRALRGRRHRRRGIPAHVRPQEAAHGADPRQRRRLPVRRRGAAAGQPGPPQHRPRARLRGDRRRVLHGRGVRRRPRPREADGPLPGRGRYPAAHPGRLLRRPRDLAGARLRARDDQSRRRPPGDRPPRHRRREPARLPDRRGQADRLRHRGGERQRRQDDGRDGQRERQLHVARAGPGTDHRQPERPLLLGAGPLLHADGPGALRLRQRSGRPLSGHQRPDPRRLRAHRQSPRAGRRDPADGPGLRSAGAVPDRG